MRKLAALILTTLCLASCGEKEVGVLPDVLNRQELKTARAMVAEYDQFISLQVPKQNIPIEEAYATYLQFNAPFAKAASDADNFLPASIRIIDVIYDLGAENVKSFLVFDRKCENLRIARDGKYLPILEKLASQRDIYKRMLANIDSSDNPIVGDWLVIDEYGSIDFSREDERLVFFLNAFAIPKAQLPL